MGTSVEHAKAAETSAVGVRTRKRRTVQEKLRIVRETLHAQASGRDELLDTPGGRVFNGFHQQLGVGRSSRPQRSSSISDRKWIMGFLLM
jgi:hypothetical protein